MNEDVKRMYDDTVGFKYIHTPSPIQSAVNFIKEVPKIIRSGAKMVPNDVYELTEAMLVILEAGGFKGGGINFDAKIRRNSTDPEDLFYAHIGGMDTFARALITADNVLNKSEYKKVRADRYASYDSGKGKEFEQGKLSLEDLRTYAVENGEPAPKSGKQEYLENIINRFI